MFAITPHCVQRQGFWGPFEPDASTASISLDAITWEGGAVECALSLMRRLVVVDSSTLRCVDIKLSLMKYWDSAIPLTKPPKVLCSLQIKVLYV